MVQSVLQFGHCTTPEEGVPTVGRFLRQLQLPQALPIQSEPQPVSTGTVCAVQCIRCVLSVCSTHLHAFTHAHTHTHIHHMSEHTAPITCPQGKYVHAVLINRHHPHMLLCSCMHAQRTHTLTRKLNISLVIIYHHTINIHAQLHAHGHTDTRHKRTHGHTQNICTASDCLDLTVVRNI